MIRRVALAASLALCLASTPAFASRYNFDYVMTSPEAVGLVRSFDDGLNTVLKFAVDVDRSQPTITNANGAILRYRAVGPYAVLPGLQHHVLVYARGVVAQVQQRSPGAALPAQVALQAAPLAQAPAEAAPAPAPATGAVIAAKQVSRVALPPCTSGGPHPCRLSDAPGGDAAPPADPVVIKPDSAEPPPPLPVWASPPGNSLRQTLRAWADKAGWTVVWDATVDYDLIGATEYRGQFLDALRDLLKPYATAAAPLHADAFTKQRILHVTE